MAACGRLMSDSMDKKKDKAQARAARKFARSERLRLFDDLLKALEDVYYHWPLATYGNTFPSKLHGPHELLWEWTEQDKEKIKLLIDRAREAGNEPQVPTV